jgi:alkanesulfonate monooxygenase SsuD/methylene tetrahydromethanopterin reductase-like flavin-dependent oxidoreductase (luciferase family)
MPTLEEANEYTYTLHEQAIKQNNQGRFVIGSVEKVAAILRKLAKEALVDEVMLFDMYPTMESKINGYQLLAKEFKLD